MSRLRVFITHGRNLEERDRLISFIKTRSSQFGIDQIDFSSISRAGDFIPDRILSLPEQAHAAIILITPDDIGGLSPGPATENRARENVWMELGLFLGRLGIRRTLVLVKGDVKIISNFQGILYAHYTRSLRQVASSIDIFLNELRTSHPRDISEVVYFSNDFETRDRDWSEIHSHAKNSLIITGVGMGRVADAIPALGNNLRKNCQLKVKFIVVDPRYIAMRASFFEKYHGRRTREDNLLFFEKLKDFIYHNPIYMGRFEVYLYRGYPVFSAVVADGGLFGSKMLFQTTLPRARERGFDAPRLSLRRIVEGGFYDSYWSAVLAMLEEAKLLKIPRDWGQILSSK